MGRIVRMEIEDAPHPGQSLLAALLISVAASAKAKGANMTPRGSSSTTRGCVMRSIPMTGRGNDRLDFMFWLYQDEEGEKKRNSH
jgi:hypothetical protein